MVFRPHFPKTICPSFETESVYTWERQVLLHSNPLNTRGNAHGPSEKSPLGPSPSEEIARTQSEPNAHERSDDPQGSDDRYPESVGNCRRLHDVVFEAGCEAECGDRDFCYGFYGFNVFCHRYSLGGDIITRWNDYQCDADSEQWGLAVS